MNLITHVCICKEGCVINSNQSSFSVYGSKTNYLLQNPGYKNVSKYIIDDCVLAEITDGEKCDYLFLVDNSENTDGYFVELKGGDVAKAINQLINSINNLKENISGAMFGRIVPSKFRKAPNTFSNNGYIKLRKMLSGNIDIKNSRLSDTI